MMYRLPNGSVVIGSAWVTVGEVQYLIDRLDQDQLDSLGITVIPQYDDTLYSLSNGTVVERELPDAKRRLKEKVAAERWNRELGGFYLNGVRIPTDQQTRSVVTAAYLMASQNPNFSITNFKIPEFVDQNGDFHETSFTPLSNADILAFGNGMIAFIQGCYDRNKDISDEIDAISTFAELAAFTWSWE